MTEMKKEFTNCQDYSQQKKHRQRYLDIVCDDTGKTSAGGRAIFSLGVICKFEGILLDGTTGKQYWMGGGVVLVTCDMPVSSVEGRIVQHSDVIEGILFDYKEGWELGGWSLFLTLNSNLITWEFNIKLGFSLKNKSKDLSTLS